MSIKNEYQQHNFLSNTGFGTVSPSEKVDIAGNINISSGNTYKINGTDVLSGSSLGTGVTSSSLTTVGTLSSLTVSGDLTVDTTTLKVDSTNNRVGVGIIPSNSKLAVGGDLGVIYGNAICFKNNNDVSYTADKTLYNYYTGFEDLLQIQPSGNSGGIITFNAGTAQATRPEVMRIHVNQNVGINNNNPQYKLDIGGNINLSSGNTYKINGTDVLSGSSLGSGVTSSSLTSVGTLSSLTVSGDLTVDTSTLKVDSTNNRVGVGTALPGYTLDLIGNANLNTGSSGITINIAGQSSGTISFGNGSALSSSPLIVSKSSNNTGLNLVAATSNTNVNGDMIFDVREDDNTDFADLTKRAFIFSRTDTNSLMTILRNGNVAIGKTTADYKLDVNGTINTNARLIITSNGGLSQSLNFTNITPPVNVSELGYIDFRALSPTTSTSRRGAVILGLSAQTWTETSTPGRLLFYTTPIGSLTDLERMRITESGNVGIGTNTPTDKLNIRGRLSIENDAVDTPRLIFKSGPSGTNNWTLQTNNSDVFNGNFSIYNKTNERITLTPAGNLGIGTTTPSHLLQVNTDTFGVAPSDSSFSILATKDGNTNDNTRIVISGVNRTTYGGGIEYITANSGVNNSHKFLNGSTELMRLSADGNLGIGTTSPATKLDVRDGSIKSDASAPVIGARKSGTLGQPAACIMVDGTGPMLLLDESVNDNLVTGLGGGADYFYIRRATATGDTIFQNARSTNATTAQWGMLNNGDSTWGTFAGEGMRLLASNGNVGIGTTNPTEKLDVNGAIKSTTTTKAWVNFDGVPATPTIRASYNVSSVTKLSTGRYRITYTNALSNANYAVSGMAQRNYTTTEGGGEGDFKISVLAGTNPPSNRMTTTFVEVETGPNSVNLQEDAYMASVIIFNT